MTNHAETSEHSRNICDLIVDRLNQKAKTPVKHAQKMCSIGRNPVFLYVYHQKVGVTIYLYCDISDIDGIRSLTKNVISVETRHSLESDWAKITPYFIRIRTQQEAELVPAIFEFLASKPRDAKSPRRTPIYVLPSEDGAGATEEGGKVSVLVNRYERDSKNRSACIKIYGAVCIGCGFDFAKTYGVIGKGFIHVHHLMPLSQVGRKHKIDPEFDLRPVCPNCHEMLHKRAPPFTIEELRDLIDVAKSI
jgi:HNH endonuclease